MTDQALDLDGPDRSSAAEATPRPAVARARSHSDRRPAGPSRTGASDDATGRPGSADGSPSSGPEQPSVSVPATNADGDGTGVPLATRGADPASGAGAADSAGPKTGTPGDATAHVVTTEGPPEGAPTAGAGPVGGAGEREAAADGRSEGLAVEGTDAAVPATASGADNGHDSATGDMAPGLSPVPDERVASATPTTAPCADGSCGAGVPDPASGTGSGGPDAVEVADVAGGADASRDAGEADPASGTRPGAASDADHVPGAEPGSDDRHVGGAQGGPGCKEPVFFGRQRELKALAADIEQAGLDTLAGRKAPRARVLLIAGRPGTGRTALAEQLARTLADRYPDGILRVRLAEPGGRPVPMEEAARGLLDRLRITSPPGAGDDELTEMVREALAVRRVLLLVDDVTEAEQVDLLLPQNPDCLVVAVSRGPLTGIPDVRPCTLGGLDAKSAIELLTTFTGSVRITVDPQAAEAIAEECGGEPAALVLVGGWLAARPGASVADAAKRLRGLPPDEEHPTGARPLARAFRLVYESLPQSAARTLRLLALAPAGRADAHAASALSGGSVPAAQEMLERFAALGLVRPAGSSFEVPGALAPLLRTLMESTDRPAEVQLARARMLERTVRRLQACRAVTEPEGSPARRKVAALPRALRFSSPGAAAEWLRASRSELLASARLVVDDGELDTLARRLVAALVRALAAHWGTEAAAPELYGLHQLVLDVAERRGLHREQAAALLNLADLDAQTGRTADALARYRAALDAGRAANDPYATGRAMESVGGAHQEMGDWQRAADWYGRALAQRQARGEHADEARLYGRLGAAYTHSGRYGEALRSWRAAVAGYRRVGDLPSQARALSEAARVQEYAGRPEECLRTCQEAMELARRAGEVRLHAALQLRLADTLDRLGDPAAARLHRSAAERMLGTEDSTYEIRGSALKD